LTRNSPGIQPSDCQNFVNTVILPNSCPKFKM
jgi:hypothetical protein